MASRKKRPTRSKPDLREYERKRDFDRTAEPRGGDVEASPSGRLFVVQKHAATSLHFDLRLEMDGVLKSWAVPKGPSLDHRQKVLAVHVEDHPIEYGSFEGVIPPDEYGGGTVMLWDTGDWEPIEDPHDGYERGDLKFRLHGEKLRGDWVLARMSGDAGGGGRNWLLIKKQDTEARPVAQYNVQAELPFSVASGRTMEQIAADPEAVWKDGRAQTPGAGDGAGATAADATVELPDPAALDGVRRGSVPAKPRPQLCGTADVAPAGEEWLHEIKLDGYRLLCRIEGGVPRLLTRNGHDWTEKFPAVARAAGRLPVDDGLFDGEVVVLDAAGVSDFGALQGALGSGTRRAFTYSVFDAPYVGGWDLTRVPLVERKAFLAALLDAAPMVAPTIQYCQHIVGNGPIVFDHAAEYGFEGIISKRADAAYVDKRSDTWLKVKARHRQDFVVGGWTEGEREGFGALLIGYHDARGRLTYCGRVGTGFDARTLETLAATLAPLGQDAPPFVNAEADPDAAAAHWVRPELVVEVEFTSWTSETLVRQAAFLRVRDDVMPGSVRREARPAAAPTIEATAAEPAASGDDAAVAGVRISHPDRTVYPEDRVTKGDVAAYYARIADWILPHVTRRPLSIVRCPLGLAGDAFYQRHVGEGFPDCVRGTPSGAEIEGEPFLLIDDLTGLLSLIQMGVLEIHTWGCREDDLERPDHVVFDLDPGPGIRWEDVVGSGHFVRKYLDDLGLESFAKTTGGRGLHVVVPLVRRGGWPEAKAFVHAVATDMVRIAPRNFVATMSKAFRRNRVFIDYLRNTRGNTAVAPFSTRARPGACVSTPLAWEELTPDRPPSSFTVRTVPERLESIAEDPWEAFRTLRQSVTAKMRRTLGI
jgi:bifunctional non-homologous end joining protein LigD